MPHKSRKAFERRTMQAAAYGGAEELVKDPAALHVCYRAANAPDECKEEERLGVEDCCGLWQSSERHRVEEVARGGSEGAVEGDGKVAVECRGSFRKLPVQEAEADWEQPVEEAEEM